MLVEDFGGFRLVGEDAGEGGEVFDGVHFLIPFLVLCQDSCLMVSLYCERRATIVRHAVMGVISWGIRRSRVRR